MKLRRRRKAKILTMNRVPAPLIHDSRRARPVALWGTEAVNVTARLEGTRS